MFRFKVNKMDILFWANINPNKRGSFEDYICFLSRFCKKKGLKIKFVLGNEINTSVQEIFKEFNVNYHLLPINKMNSMTAILKVLLNTKPRIVHFHFVGLGSPMIILSKAMGVSFVIMTEHSSVPIHKKYITKNNLVEKIKKLKRSFVMSRIDYVIGVSNFVSQRLQNEYGFPPEKVKLIYNGVNLGRFIPPKDGAEKGNLKNDIFHVNNNINVVTYMGQLIEEKGIFYFLDSIKLLLKNYNDILFIIVGTGPLESSLKNWLKEIGSKMVKFLGLRDDGEVIMKASDIVVVPSIWEEAFGLVIAEASACGVPVIGSRIGGIPEVIIDQKTGILTTPCDAEELALAIVKLVNNKKLRDSFSYQGRKYIEQKFDLNVQVSETINLYRLCLNQCLR